MRVQKLLERDLQPEWKAAWAHKKSSCEKKDWTTKKLPTVGGKNLTTIKIVLQGGKIENDWVFQVVLAPEK